MNDRYTELMEKLIRVAELCQRPGSEGERLAANQARDRLLRRLLDMHFETAQPKVKRYVFPELKKN